MARAEEKRSVFDVVTDRICESLKGGVVPWRRPWSDAAIVGASDPRNLVSGKPYNGINIFLLGLQPFTSPFWLTYNQARGLGGHVKKGEKGTPIFFWKIYDNKKPSGSDEETERRFIGRYYTVFNLEQCEGIAAPAAEPEPKVKSLPTAKRIVAGYKDGPIVRHIGARACYSPMGDVVMMPPLKAFESPQAYYGTLFHELTHSTGHEKRLKRFDNTQPFAPFGSADYSREELVAEMGAAFLCAKARIDNHVIDNQASYVRNWLDTLRGDTRAVVFAASQARKGVELILGTAEQTDEEEAA